MTSTLLRPYELPPFELVKLVQPAFQNLPRFDIASLSTSPPGSSAGPSSSISPPTLSGRLSQLVNKNAGITQQQKQLASPAEVAPTTPIAGQSSSVTATPSATSKSQTIRSAEAGGDTVWIAGNEGSVAVWKLDPSRSKGKQRAILQDDSDHVAGTAEESAYLLDQYGVVPGRRPVEKLAVLSTVAKAVVLSEGILTIHSLPTFANLQAFAPIRGVSTFAVDLSNPHTDAVPLCVIKRKSMQLYSISQYSIELIKELPLRTTAILGVLRGPYLCIADAVNYSLVDLESATLVPLLPISQDMPDSPPADQSDRGPQESARPKSHQRPSILAVGEDEFLIASHTGHSTLGLFIRENGEPTRGTLEWASNPRSIVVDHPYVVALLHNNTVEIHSIITQEIVQVVQLATSMISKQPSSVEGSPVTPASKFTASPKQESLQPRTLISCSAGFPSRHRPGSNASSAFSPLLVPQSSGASSLATSPVRLLPQQSLLDAVDTEEKPTAPSTPKRSSSMLTASRPSARRRTSASIVSTVAANTLLLGRDSVFALCPLTLVAQADALMANSRVEDALKLLEAVGPPDTPEKFAEFCYIKQKAAWSYLRETRFKEAGTLFLEGRTDPRLLIRLFPDISGKMFDNVLEEQIDIYKGLQDVLGEKTLHSMSIDGIIRNYSPHLPPTSPPVTDLHTKLEKEARSMLKGFLQLWRDERRSDGLQALGFDSASEDLTLDLDRLVDTSLAKLYLEAPSRLSPLLDMLEREAHDCDVDELASLLEKRSLHWYLSQLYLAQGRIGEVLTIWTELVDGERTDELFSDGLGKVFSLLETVTSVEQVTKYGLWLAERDANLGLKLLMKPAHGVSMDVAYCLDKLKAIDKEVAERFLEHGVFTRRNLDASYHNELVHVYIAKLSQLFNTTELEVDLQKLRTEYAESASTADMSIVSYAMSRGTLSPDVSLRGKLILVLHASHIYDTQRIREKLESMSELYFEKAVVYSKLGLHGQALNVLATVLRDTPSANAYCTHAGAEVFGPRLVREICDKLSIPIPLALYRKDGRRRHNPPNLPLPERESKRKSLLNSLIKITLQQASTDPSPLARQRAAHTIENQALHISASEILPSIPDGWPLPLMESFIVRNLRRSLHDGYERKLTKAILQGQALDASLRYWEVTDSLGGTLAEEVDSDDEKGDHDDGYVVNIGEKQERDVSTDEKAVDLL